MVWRFDSVPQIQFSVDATPRRVDVMSRGFDSPGVWVRLPGAPGGKKVRSGKSDGVGSPERSPSSHDVVIACVVSSQKRGVDMTRGNYVSATIRGIRRPHGQATADNGDFPRSVKRGARPGCPLPFPSLFLHLCASCGERPALRLRAFFTL